MKKLVRLENGIFNILDGDKLIASNFAQDDIIKLGKDFKVKYKNEELTLEQLYMKFNGIVDIETLAKQESSIFTPNNQVFTPELTELVKKIVEGYFYIGYKRCLKDNNLDKIQNEITSWDVQYTISNHTVHGGGLLPQGEIGGKGNQAYTSSIIENLTIYEN